MNILEVIPFTILIITTFSVDSRALGSSSNDHVLMSDQLCPNPITKLNLPRNKQNPKVVSVSPSDLLHAAWRRKTCIFSLEDESRVLIRAISSSPNPWNYSAAQQCEGTIEMSFQMEDSPTLPEAKQWCKIDRWKDESKDREFFNPELWLYPTNKFGIYFSTEWKGNINSDNLTNNPSSEPPPRFIQLAFNILSNTVEGKKCILRVQQYAINHKRLECHTWEVINQNCGVYDCLEDQIEVLDRMNYSITPTRNQSQGSNQTYDYFLEILNLNEIDELADAKRRQLERYMSLIEMMGFAVAFFTGVYLFLFSYMKRRKMHFRVEDPERALTFRHRDLWLELVQARTHRCSICCPDT